MAGLISRKFVPQGQRGVSDVLSMAFMFLLVIFSGVLLHGYGLDAIGSATDRQLQMKAEYIYRTFELAQVENYSLSYFEAIAENLIQVTEPVVPVDYLENQIDNLLAYVCPSGYTLTLTLTNSENENARLEKFYPREPSVGATQFTFSGKVTIIIGGDIENKVVRVNAKVTLSKL